MADALFSAEATQNRLTVRLRALAAAVTVAVAVALAGCGGASGGSGSGSGGNLVEIAKSKRAAAPALTGNLLDGGTFDLAAQRGQVVVVNFWASWCPPCRVEAPDLEAVYQATKGRGVTFVGIDIRDDRDKAKAFHDGRTSYPSIFDPAGRLALDFNVPPNTIPATLIIDRSGKLAAVMRTSVHKADLEPIVTRLVAEPAGAAAGKPSAGGG
jgi:thiol-disulfide isomerase/thioredoxin